MTRPGNPLTTVSSDDIARAWPGEIPASTCADACRWFEDYLESKYPGTRWHVGPKRERSEP